MSTDRKLKRFEGTTFAVCGGVLATWWMGLEITAYDEDTSEPPLLHHQTMVEFRDGKRTTPISSVDDLLQLFASRTCVGSQEILRDPYTFSRILQYLVFPESGIRVISEHSLEKEHLERLFEFQLENHIPRIVGSQLRFSARHWPPDLGPDGRPVAPPSGSLPAFDTSHWRVISVTVDLDTGRVETEEVLRRPSS
ncbi:MAG: hypothetical protein KIT31_04000 [Deltaproteobacteria bacterium]|nr:hypothetical protein [Deltaproteobacteria bacterium]